MGWLVYSSCSFEIKIKAFHASHLMTSLYTLYYQKSWNILVFKNFLLISKEVLYLINISLCSFDNTTNMLELKLFRKD